MRSLTVSENRIAPMSQEAIDKVRTLESFALRLPQKYIRTHHVLHAGMYARTITIPAETILTGALIKIATILIIEGVVEVYVGGDNYMLRGYNVLAASAGRKQAFVTKTDTSVTMIFPTKAKSVREAEQEFTDEYERLMSNMDGSENNINITGE